MEISATTRTTITTQVVRPLRSWNAFRSRSPAVPSTSTEHQSLTLTSHVNDHPMWTLRTHRNAGSPTLSGSAIQIVPLFPERASPHELVFYLSLPGINSPSAVRTPLLHAFAPPQKERKNHHRVIQSLTRLNYCLHFKQPTN